MINTKNDPEVINWLAEAIESIEQKEEDKTDEKDGVTTSTGGYSNAVYGGVSGSTVPDDHWESDYMDLSKRQSLTEKWEESDLDFDDVDELMFNAFRRTVWWEPDDGEDFSKAPDMWRSDDYVPEFVKEFIREVIKNGVIYDQFKDVPKAAIIKIEEIFRDSLTQPQGWSVHSLASDLEDEFPGLSMSQAQTIARNETAAIMNTAREEAYKSRPDEEEYEYYWSNPQDHRTTDVCNEIIEEIDNQGGAVDLPTLKDILMDKARKYKDDPENGGTPGRVGEWLPHFECRSTFVREVYL
ncbi:gpF-like protein [Haloarcula californiae tailed virus 1]|uniref:GpF-like protein n=1 Tax=Haloarcula californiae tailed virus 1 TaxID=1273746 RepID=R4TMK8_9CAUD|nr:gpF-like protein [Haloarcula californiae tailed virus 1]AGM11967.1 gpF-like protein [Haloarcula californiae tailed virus 1]